MTFLYLVRHGETDWNLQRRIQGSTDIPLNDTGRRQAIRAASILSKCRWDAVVSSPLSRAYETASIIADTLGLDAPQRIDDIVERAYGDAEGLTDVQLSKRFSRQSVVPGRESRDHVAARVIPALVRLGGTSPAKSFIVSTHGGVIRTVLNEVAPEASSHRGAPIRNGSIHSFRLHGGSLELVAFDDSLEVCFDEQPGQSEFA